jgi:hypothetical protein
MIERTRLDVTLPLFLIFVVDKITVGQAFYFLILRLSSVNIIPPTLSLHLRFDVGYQKDKRTKSRKFKDNVLPEIGGREGGAVNRKVLHFFSFKILNPFFTIVFASSVFTFID